MNFGDILRELLEDNDITQKQLADDLNYSVHYYWQLHSWIA